MAEGRLWATRLTGLLALALIVRLGLLAGVEYLLQTQLHRQFLIPGDADGYWELAGKIAAGEDFSIYTPPRRVMRTPGFPLILAVPRFFFGDWLLPARIWLAIWGVAACGVAYGLAREFFSPTVSLWGTAITAFFPLFAGASILELSETCFAVTMIAGLWATVRCVRTNSIPAAITAGLMHAAATLIRPTWSPIAPLIVGLFFLFGWKTPGKWMTATVIGLAFVSGMTPWTARNWVVTGGHFVPTSLWMGPSLYDGWNPQATGDSEMSFFDRENLMGQMSEYEVDQTYRRRSWEFARQNPGRVLELAWAKFLRTWSPVPNADQFRSGAVHLLMGLTFWPLIILAAWAAWMHRRDSVLLLVMLFPTVFFTAVHLVFVGSVRYRIPSDYLLALLAAAGGMAIWDRLSTSMRKES